ncbi:MAG: amidohydrolase family protein, partial [Paludibacteraceae bacterium]|nr:amidohydrolase family protein [Paludibacteraceae bacterium]
MIGTDGCSSNNNLDMQEETKFAAMIAKCNYGPETLPVDVLKQWSLTNAPKVFGIDAGEIAVGKLADALLLDMNNERFVPNFNMYSNWFYASNCEAIDTMICNGKILMRNRKVQGEDEIIETAKKCSMKWMK